MKNLSLLLMLALLLPARAIAEEAPLRADLAYTLAIFDQAAAALKDNAAKINPKDLETILIALPPQKRSGQPIGLTVGDATVLLHVDLGKIVAEDAAAKKVLPDPAPFRLTLYRAETPDGAADELVGVIPDVPRDVCAHASMVLPITALPMPAPHEGPAAPDEELYKAAGPTPPAHFNCAIDGQGRYDLLKFLAARQQTEEGAWRWSAGEQPADERH